MSQDNLVKLKCQKCKRINYFTSKNKKLIKEPILLKKYCKWCRARAEHKEMKK